MAPKTFIYKALILSAIFVCNIAAACLTQSLLQTGLSTENHGQKDCAAGQKFAVKHDLPGIPKDPRAFVRFKSRAMYADNVKIIAVDAMVALPGPVEKT